MNGDSNLNRSSEISTVVSIVLSEKWYTYSDDFFFHAYGVRIRWIWRREIERRKWNEIDREMKIINVLRPDYLWANRRVSMRVSNEYTMMKPGILRVKTKSELHRQRVLRRRESLYFVVNKCNGCCCYSFGVFSSSSVLLFLPRPCCSSSTMGTCTSTARHRQKQQQHNRVASKNSTFSDIKQPPPLPPLPLSAFPNPQHLYSIPKEFDLRPASAKSFFHPSDTNSLIQLYSSHSTNPKAQIIGWMSSSTSIPTTAPARIPVLKTRLAAYHPSQTQASTSTIPLRTTNGAATVAVNNPTGMRQGRSMTLVVMIGWSDLPLT